MLLPLALFHTEDVQAKEEQLLPLKSSSLMAEARLLCCGERLAV